MSLLLVLGVHYAALGMIAAGVEVCRAPVCSGWVVEAVKTLLSVGEMAIVECVRVHLHEKHHGVQKEEDLGSPGPFEEERSRDPDG